MATNSEYHTPEEQPPTTDQLIIHLVGIFSYISYDLHDKERVTKALLDLRNLDQQILNSSPDRLANMINGLQNKIGELIGEGQVFINKNFQNLDEDVSQKITSIPQQSQVESSKWPSSSDLQTALGEKERHLTITTKRTAEDTSDIIEDVRRHVSSRGESSLLTMVDYGAALGHLVTLQQQQLEARIQTNP